MPDNECPVPAPRLLKARSTVVVCARCGAWSHRYPTFMGFDGFWECEKCGNTSTREREGRPYGHKSREWERIEAWFAESYMYFMFDYYDSVETDPPMKDLDWDAIRAWERSHGIYQMFVSVGNVEIVERDGVHHVTVGDVEIGDNR